MFYSLRRFVEIVGVLRGKQEVSVAGASDRNRRRLKLEVAVQVILSLLVVIAGLGVLLANDYYTDTTQKVAAGWIGLVLGYWFR